MVPDQATNSIEFQDHLDLDHAEIMRLRCNLSARVYKLVPFLETALTQ